VANAVPVLISSNGQLGTVSSSGRFKHDIRSLAGETEKLHRLRPVSFLYRADLDASQTRTYGLIAEEVETVWPDLVAHDKDGNIETVKYHLLTPLLLNEVQRQRQTIVELRDLLESQRRRLDALEATRRP
jgi:hypothetical protein